MIKLRQILATASLLCACNSNSEPTTSDLDTSGVVESTSCELPTTGVASSTSTTAEESTGEATATTSTTEVDPSTGSTSGLPIDCGNGELDPGEECELDEPYCHQCARDRLVFVSGFDQRYTASDLNGIAGADRLCDLLARTNNLDGPDGDRRFRAWLSDSKSSVVDRFSPAPGRYVRRDGKPIAASWLDLLDGVLLAAPRLSASGKDEFDLPVWTATTTDGFYDAKGSCEDWRGSSGSATWGVAAAEHSGWTEFGTSPCEAMLALYCFEQPVTPVCSLEACQTDDDCPFGTVCFPAVDGLGTKVCAQPCKTDEGCHHDCGGQPGTEPQVFCSPKGVCEPVQCAAGDETCDCKPWQGDVFACF